MFVPLSVFKNQGNETIIFMYLKMNNLLVILVFHVSLN